MQWRAGMEEGGRDQREGETTSPVSSFLLKDAQDTRTQVVLAVSGRAR